MPAEIHAKRFYVSGMVQGVGFRYFARRHANLLGVRGYARNLADGRVEVYAIGTDEQLRALDEQLARGPSASGVDRVTEEDAEVREKYSSEFSIEPGA